ncbi:hypothetical protein CMK18_05455 [Candidatus Poribacteria bacterium]|nr:hypothetical protein [Candidatus Poribacteria bacterium]
MHLGILKVAAMLESKGYKVDMLDLSGVENYEAVLDDYLRIEDRASVFGLTATTPQIPEAVKISKFLKRKTNTEKVILGGPHVTLMHTASKREKINNHSRSRRATKDIDSLKKIFDVLVCGDGEFAVFDALEIRKGIIDADDRHSPLFLTDNDFSSLPMPARHLVDIESYHYTIEGEKATSIIAQLGCPFKCTFCSGRNSPFLRNIRTRDVNSIVQEVEHLYLTYGMNGFMFYDDELNVNKEMINLMDELVILQRRYNTKFHLRGFIKSELFNSAQAKAMYRAGFQWILTGFESGDEGILRSIQKNATIEDNMRCIKIAKSHNLKVKALMSLGHVGESISSIQNTKNWLLEAKPDDFDCTIITTYPGSPYFDEATFDPQANCYVYVDKRTNDKLYQRKIDYLVDQDYYKGDPEGGYVSYVWTDNISAERLVEERNKLETEVREKLNISYHSARPGIVYEHSMGMGNINLPSHILKRGVLDNQND